MLRKNVIKSETGFTRLLMLKLIFLAGLGINDHRILHVSSKLILMPSILLAPGIAKKEKMLSGMTILLQNPYETLEGGSTSK